MHEDLIDERLKLVFKRMFNILPEITNSSSSKDIPEWDSLKHVMLMAEIEEEFQVKFELEDMLSMRTYGEICEHLKMKSKA